MQTDPLFAKRAAAFAGWQELAREELQANFRSFLALLTSEQLADVANGKVDIAEIARRQA